MKKKPTPKQSPKKTPPQSSSVNDEKLDEINGGGPDSNNTNGNAWVIDADDGTKPGSIILQT